MKVVYVSNISLKALWIALDDNKKVALWTFWIFYGEFIVSFFE